MKLETIMNKIQENDFILTQLQVEESYEFAHDINQALKNLAHYSIKYYDRCEEAGLTYKEATDKLGEHLRAHLVKIEDTE